MAIVLPPLVDAFMREVAQVRIPKAKIVRKRDSRLMHVLAFVLRPFNPAFMERYITTIGTTIYVPDGFFEGFSEAECLDVISHETQHMIDEKKMGILYPILYLFPQVLALFSLLALGAFWSLWMLLWLLCLLFLLPLPAPGRYMLEIRGYRTSIVFARKVYHWNEEQMEALYDWVEEQLAGRWYYFTWPFRKSIENELRNESFMKEPRYVELIAFLERHNVRAV